MHEGCKYGVEEDHSGDNAVQEIAGKAVGHDSGTLQFQEMEEHMDRKDLHFRTAVCWG